MALKSQKKSTLKEGGKLKGAGEPSRSREGFYGESNNFHIRTRKGRLERREMERRV